jgi:antitoxin component YwqK of YwqJK toxin-antitoxin module
MKKLVLLVLVSLFSLPLFSQSVEEYYHYEGMESIVFYKRTDVKTNIVIEEGEYNDGKKDGHWYIYHPDGKINFIFSYENGIKDGKWKQYDENGRLVMTIKYKNGIRISKTEHEYYLASQ